MQARRPDLEQDEYESQLPVRAGATTLMLEAVRAADAARLAAQQEAKPEKRDEERISLFWRLFGGTIFSIIALICITIYNGISNNISELRAEIAKLNEFKADAVRKDDLNSVRTQVQGNAAFRTELDSLKERAGKHRTELEEYRKEIALLIESLKKEQLATSDGLKKDAAAIDGVKEKLLALDGLKKDVLVIETLKERLATMTMDSKTLRDDLGTLKQELSKNVATEAERKDRRDAQMKQIEETIKEVQKMLLESREKIARLEGQQTPPPKPVDPKQKKD